MLNYIMAQNCVCGGVQSLSRAILCLPVKAKLQLCVCGGGCVLLCFSSHVNGVVLLLSLLCCSHHIVPLPHCLAFAPSPLDVCLSLLWIHLYQPISVSPQQIHNIRQHSTSGPPPLLLAPRASVPSVQIQGQRIIQQGLIRVANVPNASLLVNIPQVSLRSV